MKVVDDAFRNRSAAIRVCHDFELARAMKKNRAFEHGWLWPWSGGDMFPIAARAQDRWQRFGAAPVQIVRRVITVADLCRHFRNALRVIVGECDEDMDPRGLRRRHRNEYGEKESGLKKRLHAHHGSVRRSD